MDAESDDPIPQFSTWIRQCLDKGTKRSDTNLMYDCNLNGYQKGDNYVGWPFQLEPYEVAMIVNKLPLEYVGFRG